MEIAYTRGYKSTGRPSYDGLVLFQDRTSAYMVWLSDGEVEEQVDDRLSFNCFVGLDMEDAAPNSTTACHFRDTPIEANLYDAVLSEINRQLEEKGLSSSAVPS